eukprot:CAMPEP_0170551784 /NCGR_PEP_ID=MMETSP0211-20121228/9784_1 /TAXON_ID=311385 /ORGANISM="Pseudokeronopsis sp., Strain OXSARD2" /LENGTH=42 /DNA_ID= /DNA_START= /DNA_END= /DNA_ORIENTATION=
MNKENSMAELEGSNADNQYSSTDINIEYGNIKILNNYDSSDL